ncbi:transposase [Mailhella sp.]
MKFWEISDAFWEAVKPLIPENVRDPKRVYQRIAGGGRKPLDSRKVFEAIVYVLKTGTQWKALPKDIFGSPSSIHAYFKKWEAQGFFSEMWKKGLAEYEEMKGIAWEWTLDTTRNAKAAMERMGKPEEENGEASTEAGEGSSNAEKPAENTDNRIWRPVISRRSREQAKALYDKTTALFTDKFKP